MNCLKAALALGASALLACTGAAAADLAKLIQNHDATVPGFFRATHIVNGCSDLTVREDGLSGKITGHTVEIDYDPVSRVVSTAIDGRVGVTYLDEHGKVTGGHDSDGNAFGVEHLPAAIIDRAVKTDLPVVLAALKRCGWDKELTRAKDCIPTNNNTFSLPGPKDCTDPTDDPAYWDALFASMGLDYGSAFVGLSGTCQQMKEQCLTNCDAVYAVMSYACGAAGVTVAGGLLCEGIATAGWLACRSQCNANWPC